MAHLKRTLFEKNTLISIFSVFWFGFRKVWKVFIRVAALITEGIPYLPVGARIHHTARANIQGFWHEISSNMNEHQWINLVHFSLVTWFRFSSWVLICRSLLLFNKLINWVEKALQGEAGWGEWGCAGVTAAPSVHCSSSAAETNGPWITFSASYFTVLHLRAVIRTATGE